MNYIDFTPQRFLLTYLGCSLWPLFPMNKCRIILSTEKGGGDVCRVWAIYLAEKQALKNTTCGRHGGKKERQRRMNSRLILIRSEQVWKPKLAPKFFQKDSPKCCWPGNWTQSLAACEAELQDFPMSYNCSSLRKLHLQVLLEMVMENPDSLQPSNKSGCAMGVQHWSLGFYWFDMLKIVQQAQQLGFSLHRKGENAHYFLGLNNTCVPRLYPTLLVFQEKIELLS